MSPVRKKQILPITAVTPRDSGEGGASFGRAFFSNGMRQQGFVAMIVVLSMLVFSAVLILGATYLSIGEAQVSLALVEGEAAFTAAEGCAENALLLSLRDEAYDGGTYDLLGATCTVDVAIDGVRYTFSVAAEKDGFARSVEIAADREVGPPAAFSAVRWLER